MTLVLRATLVFAGLVLLALPVIAQPGRAAAVLPVDSFENGIQNWQQKSFKGHTLYRIDREEGNAVLAAASQGSASGLIKEMSFDLHSYPWLSWRWKICHVLEKGDARTKQGDDYAARVYVIFPHWIKPLTRSLNYIWANRLPVDEFLPNSFYSRAVMIAVESGNSYAGQWRLARRNILEDYRHAFGEDPPLAGAVAIMTDTDNTGESTCAWYDDLVLLPR